MGVKKDQEVDKQDIGAERCQPNREEERKEKDLLPTWLLLCSTAEPGPLVLRRRHDRFPVVFKIGGQAAEVRFI